MDAPLRLIASNPLDQLARTLEALLVVASAPLRGRGARRGRRRRPGARRGGARPRRRALREGRSGIVLEHVAGGWAFRSSREAAAACARLFEKPAQRNLSQAALETLAIVAYLGPCSRPDIARIRGVVGGLRGREPRRARADHGGRARRRRRRCDPLPDDAALRAGLRAREPFAAPAPRRHRRHAGADPRAAARGRREAHRLTLDEVARAAPVPTGRGQAPS